MRTVTVLVLLALAATLAGCGPTRAVSGHFERPPWAADRTGSHVDAKVIAFHEVDRSRWSGLVLRTQRDRDEFPGWFAAADPEVAERLALELTVPEARGPLVVTVSDAGCDDVDGVELRREGADVHTHYLEVRPKSVCDSPHDVLAIYAVDRKLVSANLTIDKEKPNLDVGPGTQVAFENLGPNRPAASAVDLTDVGKREEFLSGLDTALADRVRPKIIDATTGTVPQRIFAFVLTGCRNDGASLRVGPGLVRAELTGGNNVNCVAAENYLAVFSIEALFVPLGAQIGG